jgi:Zn-dependent protease
MTFQHVDILFQIVVFMFAISVHESAHAWTAWRLGDPTARMLGRVTLNPVKHVDPIGTILLPAIALLTHFPVIGWAKPTPVNTRNFKHYVRDDVLVSVAGPVSNFSIAIGAVIGMAAISLTSAQGSVIVRNLASPQPALTDTSSLLMPISLLLYEAMQINILLGVFNLIPVPPLDGSHVLRHFLPETIRRAYDSVGMFGLILIMFLGGRFLRMLMFPVVDFFNSLLLKI